MGRPAVAVAKAPETAAPMPFIASPGYLLADPESAEIVAGRDHRVTVDTPPPVKYRCVRPHDHSTRSRTSLWRESTRVGGAVDSGGRELEYENGLGSATAH